MDLEKACLKSSAHEIVKSDKSKAGAKARNAEIMVMKCDGVGSF